MSFLTLRLTFVFFLIALGLSGCSDLGSAPPLDYTPPTMQVSFWGIQIEDAEVLRVTYSAYKRPAGFYHEDLQGAQPAYLSNWALFPANRRQEPIFELSSNSKLEARAWAESSIVHSFQYYPSHDEIDSERETERFFEFRSHNPQSTRIVTLLRVHKLSYIDRSMFNLPSRADLIGRLNARPIDEPTVESLVQYLWFMGQYSEVGGNKALATAPVSSADTVYCAFYETELRTGDFGVQDGVLLLRHEYAVSKSSGDIIKKTFLLRTVLGVQKNIGVVYALE